MEFQVTNVRVYGIEETLKASGYPMSTELDAQESIEKAEARLVRLGKSLSGLGHDCALKGITVQMDITAPNYWWPQFQRYHFADIVSSQSKMHRILNFDIASQCNSYVAPETISLIERLVRECKENETSESLTRVLSNLPMGFNLTARVTTNYLQLKTIYKQRRTHRLQEWQVFCDFIKELPYFDKILGEQL